MKIILVFLTLFLFGSQSISQAGEADVVKVDVKKDTANNYNFSVTILHQDTGWDHYADKWDIMGEDGTLFGTRVLHHPHVNEQPFTRSLSGVRIPDSVRKVILRGHDSVHEYGGKSITVELTLNN